MHFTKMQAVGNDFVVVEEPTDLDLSTLAAQVCDRRFGIGADGLLTYKPTDGGLDFRIFNADGSEDTMCGNGLRCVVRLAAERGLIPDEGTAQTRSGDVPYLRQGKQVTLALPPPRFDAPGVPLNPSAFRDKFREQIDGRTLMPVPVPGGSFGVYAVNTGSTHAVAFCTTLPDDERFFYFSPRIERDAAFPEKTSLMWTQLTQPNQLSLRIWERGVGETLGCGTGACAAAVLAIVTGKASPREPVQVTSRGGVLLISWSGDPSAPILLTGPAETVFSGTL